MANSRSRRIENQVDLGPPMATASATGCSRSRPSQSCHAVPSQAKSVTSPSQAKSKSSNCFTARAAPLMLVLAVLSAPTPCAGYSFTGMDIHGPNGSMTGVDWSTADMLEFCQKFDDLYTAIDDDLSVWKENGISRELLDEAILKYTTLGNNKGITMGFAAGKAYVVGSSLDTFKPFIPLSHIEPERESLLMSNKMAFRLEAITRQVETMRALQIGDVVSGFVESIKPYGAFVHIGDGNVILLHISQFSHTRVDDLKEVLKEGTIIKFQILDQVEGMKGHALVA
eukprot:gene23562-9086_t